MGACMGSSNSAPKSSAGPPGAAAAAASTAPQHARRFSNAALTDKQISILEERNVSGTGEIKNSSVTARYAWATQRGHYPDEPNKQNQDSCIAIPQLGEFKDISFFGVFDGHGKDGHLCSRYARDWLHRHILENIRAAGKNLDMQDALTRAHLSTNQGLRRDSSVDDTLSGTTSISLLLQGSMMYFSNLGDSRAMLVSRSKDGRLVGRAMSSDQTPYRRDERERVKRYGARILTMEQIEGNAPMHENWGDLELGNEIDEGGDPPRIWSPMGDYPGTAFTRSIGDFFAESLGVVAEPEITVLPLSENDRYVVIASDGVFEFLTNQMVADMVESHADILSVCRAVIEVAYGLWLQCEYRTDDITIVVIAISGGGLSSEQVLTPAASQRLSSRMSPPPSPRAVSMRPVRRRPKKKTMIINSQDEFEDDDGGVTLPSPKTPEDVASIAAAIQGNFLFQNVSIAQRDAIIGAMVKVRVVADEVVILQGDRGDRFYIVDQGRFEVRVASEEDQTDPRPSSSKFAKYGLWRHEYSSAGGVRPCFGELSLMYGKPRGATVIALEAGMLWALDRRDFRKLLLRSMSSRRRLLDNLRKVKILRCLEVPDVQRLADLLVETHFAAGATIIAQGSAGDNFYMVAEGACEVTVSEDGASRTLSYLREWDYFGERALLSKEPHSSSVVASTAVRVLYINKTSFDQIFGPLAGLLDRDRLHREEMARVEQNMPGSIREMRMQVLVSQGDSFSLLQGSFGGVKLTSLSFSLSKVAAGCEGPALNTAIEVARLLRESAADLSQSFLPRMVALLRDSNALHLLLKAAIVCDLAALVKVASGTASKTSFSDDALAYMMGCVVTMLSALHAKGIVCRGIQPENLYLDADGRVVLLDHRTCKVGVVDELLAYTLVGATDYLSPEQVSLGGHGRAVDLWAMGVLLLEVATGTNPFAASGEVATFNRITSLGSASFLAVQVPPMVSASVKGLALKLVLPDPAARLGMGAGGLNLVKAEPLFSGINWNTLYLDSSPLVSFVAQMQRLAVGDDLSAFADHEGWSDPFDAALLNLDFLDAAAPGS